MECRINGEVRQSHSTSDRLFTNEQIVSFLSHMGTLNPGDVISSGTPDGVGAGRKPQEFLKPGDVVTIDIDGIGTLRTPMRANP